MGTRRTRGRSAPTGDLQAAAGARVQRSDLWPGKGSHSFAKIFHIHSDLEEQRPKWSDDPPLLHDGEVGCGALAPPQSPAPSQRGDSSYSLCPVLRLDMLTTM